MKSCLSIILIASSIIGAVATGDSSFPTSAPSASSTTISSSSAPSSIAEPGGCADDPDFLIKLNLKGGERPCTWITDSKRPGILAGRKGIWCDNNELVRSSCQLSCDACPSQAPSRDPKGGQDIASATEVEPKGSHNAAAIGVSTTFAALVALGLAYVLYRKFRTKGNKEEFSELESTAYD